jgi:glucan phosphorylase
VSEVIRCLAGGGALTIGTLDGANIEIRDEVGEESIFIFSLRADEVSSLIQTGYHSEQYMGASHNVRRVVDTIAAGHFSRGDKDLFRPIVSKLLSASDEYLNLADLAPYLETQQRVLWSLEINSPKAPKISTHTHHVADHREVKPVVFVPGHSNDLIILAARKPQSGLAFQPPQLQLHPESL